MLLLTEPWHSKYTPSCSFDGFRDFTGRIVLTQGEAMRGTPHVLWRRFAKTAQPLGICSRELCLSRERNVGILLSPWPSYVEILVTDLLQGVEYQNLPKQTHQCFYEDWMQAKTSEPIEYNLSAPIILQYYLVSSRGERGQRRSNQYQLMMTYRRH